MQYKLATFDRGRDKVKRKSRGLGFFDDKKDDDGKKTVTLREPVLKRGLIGGAIGVVQGGTLGVLTHNNDAIGESFYGIKNGNKKVTIPATITATIIGSAGNAGLSYYFANCRQKQAFNSK